MSGENNMSGTEDFSGFEVIRAAMEVEKNGHQFYAAMVGKAHTQLARDLFAQLAQDEVGHLRALEKLAPKYEDGAFWEGEEEFLPYLRRFNDKEIFPSAEAVASALVSEAGDIRALELAIEAEEKFAGYFATAAKHARDAEGEKAFAWLAEEEQRHAKLLKERKAKILGK
jgi:rubrerythrin